MAEPFSFGGGMYVATELLAFVVIIPKLLGKCQTCFPKWIDSFKFPAVVCKHTLNTPTLCLLGENGILLYPVINYLYCIPNTHIWSVNIGLVCFSVDNRDKPSVSSHLQSRI